MNVQLYSSPLKQPNTAFCGRHQSLDVAVGLLVIMFFVVVVFWCVLFSLIVFIVFGGWVFPTSITISAILARVFNIT